MGEGCGEKTGCGVPGDAVRLGKRRSHPDGKSSCARMIKYWCMTDLDRLSIKETLEEIRTELNEFANGEGSVRVYKKDIEHALERIAAIERHLGIDRDIAA